MKFQPSLSLDEDDLAQIKSWNVGSKYTLTVEVEMQSISKGPDYDYPEEGSKEKKPYTARFKVLEVKSANGESIPRDKKLAYLKEKTS